MSETKDTPTIKVKVSSLIAVLQEKDESVAKLGGEPDKKQGFAKMQEMANTFFKFEPPNVSGIWDVSRQAKIHAKLANSCSSSRLQMIGAPISICYEEQNPSVFGGPGFLMRLVVTVGRMSLKEIIVATPNSPHPSCEIDVIRFTNSSTSDVKLTYQEIPNDGMGFKTNTKTSIKIQLSPCIFTFDPGFVDRTYMLFFYSEMDPSCLVTPAINLLHEDEETIHPSLGVGITCPQLELNFHVPKVDMRKPTDIPTDEFVSLFWSRKIHPELFQLRIRQFDMQLSQDFGPKSPLSITLASDFIDILFQESETSDKLPLAVVRKSQKNIELQHKLAARISITVCMDETQRLQGKFDSNDKMNMKSNQRTNVHQGLGATDSEQFFTSAAGVSGDTRYFWQFSYDFLNN